jgi:hypothetical protein
VLFRKNIAYYLSDKEKEMFIALGYADFIETAPLEPQDMYDIAIKDVFIKDMRGNAVESLRRAYTAFRNSTCYRHTPEWDEMIKL